MIRLDYFILGYKYLTFRNEDIAKAATILLTRGLSGKIDKNGRMAVSVTELKKYKTFFSGLEYKEGEIKGFLGFAKRNRFRFGAIFALLIITVLFFLSGEMVWDVRIEGNENIGDIQLKEKLANCGLDVGVRWSSLSQNEVESNILNEVDEIAWININRRGSVAYVTLKEKNTREDIIVEKNATNIVAEFDCVIEEISVNQGYAMVKAGDTVKKGDLLISGVLPEEVGGGYVNAEGVVVGRFRECVEVYTEREERIKDKGETLLQEVSVEILGFSINIFKNYGNSPDDYVIIEEENSIIIFDGTVLPIKVRKKYSQQYVENITSYSYEQLIKISSQRLEDKRTVMLLDAELIKISTCGDFKDDGYHLKSDMTVLRNIGIEKDVFD